MKRLIYLLISAACVSSFAADDKSNCEAKLKGSRSEFKIIPSDRVPSDAQIYEEYVKELVEPGGVLDQLDIPMTGQIVEFLQGRDLNAMTSGTAGGYPVSFYLDGAAVMQSLLPRGGFALEVVYPGPQFQHGFYRDDNPVAQQMSIIDHVVGHNNFAYTSGLRHYRAGQGLLASRELDDVLRTLYATYNKSEVQRFYLWALTLARQMDWYTPYYQSSEELEAKLEVSKYDPLGRSPPKIKRHPKAPTENILPAFAANLAPHEPEWKRKILDLIHSSMAFRPALVHTQVMNEGWASIMQEIIPKHTKNNHHFAFWFQASRVMQTEHTPNLSDPYSLGVFCWRRLREKFMDRPEIAALSSSIEQDRAFIRYANEEIISRLDDQQFLRLAMDQLFIDRHNLAVVRRATEQEIDPNMQPPPANPNEPPPAQWIVVSRKAERVVQAVIDRVLKPKYQWNPRVRLMDFIRPESGEVEMVIDDSFGNGMALEKETLAPALYAKANVIGKPISLDANIAKKVIEYQSIKSVYPYYPFPDYKFPVERLVLVRVRVVVSPNGDVKVYEVTSERGEPHHEKFNEELTEQIASHLRAYVQDLYLDDQDELENVLEQSQTLREIRNEAIAKFFDDTPYDTLLLHAPNAAGAINEYKDMVQRRLLIAMELAARGQRQLRIVGRGVRIKALPSQVSLSFDEEWAQQTMEATEGASVDLTKINRTVATEKNLARSPFGDYSGQGGTVGGIDGNPGDRFWGPGQPPPGEGSGSKPGEDPNDLSWVDIPADLYSRFLGERVKLPILNRKPGLSRTQKFKPGRKVNRRQGQALPTDIMDNAFKRGYGKKITEGVDPLDDLEGTIDEGFASMLPRDWVVKNQVIAKKPDVKAVVTFVLDASGSTARYMESFKRFVYDIETLVAAKYRGFAFRYIIFDTQAHVLKTKEEFFRSELGGGTAYASGLKAAQKVFEEDYPRSAYDRYTFLMGDMEDFSPEETFGLIKDILNDSEYMGVVAGLNNREWAQYIPLYQAVAADQADNPQLGLTVLDQDGGYRIDHIREVLKNKDEE